MFFKINKIITNVLMLLLAIIVMSGVMSDVANARVYHHKVRLIGQEMHRWEVESTDSGGTLIFSDSPEYVQENGILYSDTVQGDARVLFYHLNESWQDKRLAVVLENENDTILKVHISRGHTSSPDCNYMSVGKETQLAYFGETMDEDLTIMPKRRKVMDNVMNRQILHPGELVYGVYDFHSDYPVKVSVVMCPEDQMPAQFVKKARQLPKDEHMLRGTFKGMNRVIVGNRPYDPQKDGLVYIPIGDDFYDKYVTGIDATDGSQALNYGNYGILYKLQLPTVRHGHTQYFLSPLGGVYAGAMTAQRNQMDKSILLPTPKHTVYFGEKTLPDTEEETRLWQEGIDHIKADSEIEDLGMYSNEDEMVFEFSPPGASNLPVNIIMAPGKE